MKGLLLVRGFRLFGVAWIQEFLDLASMGSENLNPKKLKSKCFGFRVPKRLLNALHWILGLRWFRVDSLIAGSL